MHKDKDLKYNQYIHIYLFNRQTAMPPILKKQCCSEETSIQSLEILSRQSWWRHCKVSSVCKYNPTKGDAHKSSLANKYSSSHVQPWSSRFAKAPPKPWETFDMVKEEEEKKSEVPFGVKNEAFPTVAWRAPWTSWNGGSITIHESQFPLLAKLV